MSNRERLESLHRWGHHHIIADQNPMRHAG
jgi:hypothetical protein